MSNMSYCRFENTWKDLVDCREALDNNEELSESEQEYKERLISLCEDIGVDYGEVEWNW